MKGFRFLFLTVVVFGFTLPPADVKLQYQFKAGDQYTWAQDTKQTIKQTVMGMEQVVTNTYTGSFLLKVESLTATGAKLQVQYKTLKNSTKSPMGETVMDSEGTQETTENKVFKALMNKPFSLFMNKRGEVEKLENVDNLWSGFDSLAMDENTKNAMRQSLQQFMSDAALKSTFEQVFITYPEKSVKQGDTWKSKSAVPMNMTIENTWKVTEISSASAFLTGDGLYSPTDTTQILDLPGGFKAKTDLKGKQAMKSNINAKTGWPTKMDVLSELKGNMTLLAGGMIPEDMDVPMEILSETTFTISKK